MWPEVPKSDTELAQLKAAVLKNPLVYGAYVSPDLKRLSSLSTSTRTPSTTRRYFRKSWLSPFGPGDGVKVRVVGNHSIRLV